MLPYGAVRSTGPTSLPGWGCSHGLCPRSRPAEPGCCHLPPPPQAAFLAKLILFIVSFFPSVFFSPAAEPKNSRMGSGGAAICMQNGAICLPAAGFCSGTWQGWQQGCGGQQDGDSPQTITDALHIPLIPLGLVPCDPLLRDRDPLVQAHLETL